MDNATIALIGSLVSAVLSVLSTYMAMNSRKARSESEKMLAETEKIRQQLERGEFGDLSIFVESFYATLSIAYELLLWGIKTLREHPEINGQTEESLQEKKEKLDEIQKSLRSYFVGVSQ